MTAAELSRAVEVVVLESARKDMRIAELESAVTKLSIARTDYVLTGNASGIKQAEDALFALMRRGDAA